MVSKFGNKIAANPGIQAGAMKKAFPQFRAKERGDTVVFTGKLRAKPELPEYSVKVVYRGERRPQVFITNPKLNKAPHTYRDGSLCLYHGSNYSWQANRLIAKEIMHWTIAWIYFYEYWKDTGVWMGPSVPHSGVKED